MIRALAICFLVFALAGCKKSVTGLAQSREQAAIDDRRIQEYIDANNLVATKVMRGNADTTGIWFVRTSPGTTNALITSSSLLTLGYAGRLLGNNTAFVQTGDFHPAFRLGEMIKGWQYYFLNKNGGIRKGEKIRLIIASRYAYGPYEQPVYNLPADAILDFDIELFEVTN
ncbi:FKBP-type peptidyl-prolyl cis-trans isomerase [Mucilaginibacter myungsuensis]|uniref:Peptidyl-prolyl cis-trans isomerase n=1 Tax=Mucilaginibacter myungsuensis TaxID=649104 RepID=A0A929PYE2_9SPHI|nr:FKBP-type peptidyl-prolyl cis-trans isomerase [Mucilaginibacter myungsuensis]MBE9664161.1 FKBP-type peptidyl-prolyl cis-trans isomerase [Mucilaginibacter myungsuensis]MDN3599864.1 FKBP-type peptidyl-prolyl cis-trans isomerase [Mucilaginibacter myungsuensis]